MILVNGQQLFFQTEIEGFREMIIIVIVQNRIFLNSLY